MPKRHATESPAPSPKRFRPNAPTHISRLSDELFLRIASYLSIKDLASCQRVSRRFARIAGDGQIWKAQFYHRFVWPRASRIPGLSRSSPSSLHYSSKKTRWLDDEGLARDSETNWKELYKLRHNWNIGSCGVREIDIVQEPPMPPSMPPSFVRLHKGIVFTVDSSSGLRAWRLQGGEQLLSSTKLYRGRLNIEDYGSPSALAVDEDSSREIIGVAVGFEKGGYAVYQLDIQLESSSTFELCYLHARPVSSAGSGSHAAMITAMAYYTPYLLTMTESQLFTVFRLKRSADDSNIINEDKDIKEERLMHAPKILSSLRSHTVWPPLSLSLRRSAQNVVLACIVYAFPLYVSGWSVGIQELRLTEDAEGVGQSRIATAVPAGFAPIAASISGSPSPTALPPRGSGLGSRSRSQIHDASRAQPTSLSYSHPYLLASHEDNTLTLYLVKSTVESLSIDSGQRLWGHTSGVSSAQVGVRGKAVSVSTRGSELRVWELEGGLSMRRRVNASVKVEPQPRDDVDEGCPDAMGWLGGFDEEKVVVLKENSDGRQALEVYDFTH
ncbi:hypothetical protein RUND412_000991 [Rhizina undulata]